MVKNLNDILKKYWIAYYNIGLRKVLLVGFVVALIIVFSLIIKIYLASIIGLLLFLFLIFLLINSLIKYGYNKEIATYNTSQYVLYDNKKLFSSEKNTRVFSYLKTSTYSRAWISKKQNDLSSAYMTEMVEFISKNLSSRDKKNTSVLHLGGSLNSIPLFLAAKHPNVYHDVVEVDKNLSMLSKKYFYPLFNANTSNINVLNIDARKFIKQNMKKYHVIIQDITANGVPPKYFLTNTWIEKLIKSSLKTNGLLILCIGVPTSQEVFNLALNFSEKTKNTGKIRLKQYDGFSAIHFKKRKR